MSTLRLITYLLAHRQGIALLQALITRLLAVQTVDIMLPLAPKTPSLATTQATKVASTYEPQATTSCCRMGMGTHASLLMEAVELDLTA